VTCLRLVVGLDGTGIGLPLPLISRLVSCSFVHPPVTVENAEEECHAAIAEFESPDPQSRTSEHEGRRIKPIEGGWLVLNGEYYRKLLSAAERKEYNRVKQAEYRKRKKTIEHDGACAGATQAINEGFAHYNKE